MEQRVSLITLGVRDVAASRSFYERLGWGVGLDVQETVFFQAGEPTENLHVAFETTDDAMVDAFHEALTNAGYADNGAPGEREYHAGYYGAFVLDPDGNNVEVVNHNRR